MYYVYILFSEHDKRLTIGSSPDLAVRIQKHDAGYVRSTKNRRPVRLIYSEAYLSSHDAQRREVYLKGGKGHGELKIQLHDTFRKHRYRDRF